MPYRGLRLLVIVHRGLKLFWKIQKTADKWFRQGIKDRKQSKVVRRRRMKAFAGGFQRRCGRSSAVFNGYGGPPRIAR